MFIPLQLLVLLLIAVVSSCTAFVPSHRIVGKFCSYDVHKLFAKDDESSDDGSNTINIAIISAPGDSSSSYDTLPSTLDSHPFCKMTGVQLSMSEITADTSWNKDEVVLLQQAEIACFTSKSAIKQYLQLLDDHLKVPKDIADEERRKLPNKLDIVGDILGTTQQIATIMAACPTMDIARECLNSGRWQNNHIYYPKDTQGVVEMKTEEIGENDKEEEVEVEIDVAIWVDAIVQAAGDVYERSFWGGGW